MNSKQLRLVWDFRGPDSSPTATHFLEHLKSYLNRPENKVVQWSDTGITTQNELWSSCYLIIQESNLEKIKTDLKPHRGNYL